MQDEHAFLAKLLQRDTLACHQLVKEHHGRLVIVARAIVGESAEDVVQEGWLLAFRALPTFEGRSSLKTWLTRIVINAAYSRHRYDKTRFTVSLDEVMDEGMPLAERFDKHGHWQDPLAHWQSETPEELLGRAELASILQKAMQTLPDAQRLVWLLRDQSGLEFKEIAESLKTSEANVRVMLHRARLKLMAVINSYEEGKPC